MDALYHLALVVAIFAWIFICKKILAKAISYFKDSKNPPASWSKIYPYYEGHTSDEAISESERPIISFYFGLLFLFMFVIVVASGTYLFFILPPAN